MPTSPVSDTEIDAVFGDDARPSALAAPAPTLVGEWRRLGAFLARPQLPRERIGSGALTVLGRIYLLDMAMMLVLIGIAGAVVAMGVELPETALAGIEITPLIAVFVILLAPVLEEIGFRSWLNGRPALIAALMLILAGAVMVPWIAGGDTLPTWALLTGAALVLVAAPAAAVALFRRPTPAWFAKAFPLFFWGATIAFALVHLANFSEGSLAMLLPLVVPQFLLGALLGYVRVRIGLWAAIALHAAHNATALSIAVLAMAGD